jgi:hypothetical protein
MSSFEVDPDSLNAHSARLAGIRDSVVGMQTELRAHVGAGGGTSLGDAMDRLLGRWGQMLPLYGECGARLTAAIADAGAAYTVTDARVAVKAVLPEPGARAGADRGGRQ